MYGVFHRGVTQQLREPKESYHNYKKASHLVYIHPCFSILNFVTMINEADIWCICLIITIIVTIIIIARIPIIIV